MLAWPGDAPLWLLVVLVVVVGVGGPASMIGFDLGRTSNPARRLASATGIINQGGFLASLVLVIAIGLILDWRTPGGGSDYPAEAFRWAMSFQYLLWGLGLVQIWRYRRRTRARILADDPDLALFNAGPLRHRLTATTAPRAAGTARAASCAGPRGSRAGGGPAGRPSRRRPPTRSRR